jgi:nucleoside-diphosphate-sugar epimerase
MSVKNKKILITGATGFVGSNIVRRLVRLGAKVSILVREDSLLWRIDDLKNEIEINVADISKGNRLMYVISDIKPDGIIHTAVYGAHPFQKNFHKIFGINFDGTVNILNACKKAGFGFFINTGSSSEYGIKGAPMKETDLLEPVCDYGIAKAAVSLYCSAKAKTEGLPITTLRLFSPYGYYEDKTRLVPHVFLSVLRNESPRLASPENVRDFIFIEDVVEAYLKAIENIDKAKGQVLNIGSGEQHSVSELVEKVIHMDGNKLMPVWGAIANSRKEPKCWQADISNAGKLLDWRPKYDLDGGLSKTLDWFRKNMELYGHCTN